MKKFLVIITLSLILSSSAYANSKEVIKTDGFLIGKRNSLSEWTLLIIKKINKNTRLINLLSINSRITTL